MKKLFILLVLALAYSIVFCTPTNALEKFSSADEVNDWVLHYYLKQDIKLVVPAIKALFKYGFFDKDSAVPPTLAFLSTLFQQNEDLLEGWLMELSDLNSREKQFLWIALDLSNSSKGQQLLRKIKDKEAQDENKKFIEDLLNSTPKDILQMKINSPSVLDMLWGKFFASGDRRCIQRIISVLPWLEQKDDIERMLIGGAAQWSLTANAKQHKLVLDICREEYQTQPDEVKKALKEIIEKAKSK